MVRLLVLLLGVSPVWFSLASTASGLERCQQELRRALWGQDFSATGIDRVVAKAWSRIQQQSPYSEYQLTDALEQVIQTYNANANRIPHNATRNNFLINLVHWASSIEDVRRARDLLAGKDTRALKFFAAQLEVFARLLKVQDRARATMFLRTEFSDPSPKVYDAVTGTCRLPVIPKPTDEDQRKEFLASKTRLTRNAVRIVERYRDIFYNGASEGNNGVIWDRPHLEHELRYFTQLFELRGAQHFSRLGDSVLAFSDDGVRRAFGIAERENCADSVFVSEDPFFPGQQVIHIREFKYWTARDPNLQIPTAQLAGALKGILKRLPSATIGWIEVVIPTRPLQDVQFADGFRLEPRIDLEHPEERVYDIWESHFDLSRRALAQRPELGWRARAHTIIVNRKQYPVTVRMIDADL